MNVVEKTADLSMTLKKGCVQCQGLSLRYCLNAICENGAARYEIEVTLDDGERACATVGDDVEIALSCFDAICRGAVTPCTLLEVVGEMRIGY